MRYLLLVLEDDAEIEFDEDTGLEFDEALEASERVNALLLSFLDKERAGKFAVGEIQATAEGRDRNVVQANFAFNVTLEVE